MASALFNQKIISAIDVDPEIPYLAAKLRSMLVKARDENPSGLERLMTSEESAPSLANWEKMNLMEFALDNPFSIRYYYDNLKEFLGG